jgi:hypothetical protein
LSSEGRPRPIALTAPTRECGDCKQWHAKIPPRSAFASIPGFFRGRRCADEPIRTLNSHVARAAATDSAVGVCSMASTTMRGLPITTPSAPHAIATLPARLSLGSRHGGPYSACRALILRQSDSAGYPDFGPADLDSPSSTCTKVFPGRFDRGRRLCPSGN